MDFFKWVDVKSKQIAIAYKEPECLVGWMQKDECMANRWAFKRDYKKRLRAYR